MSSDGSDMPIYVHLVAVTIVKDNNSEGAEGDSRSIMGYGKSNRYDVVGNYSVLNCSTCQFLGSIVVSISACHAEDPGSIPGRGVPFFIHKSACTGVLYKVIVHTKNIVYLDYVVHRAEHLRSFNLPVSFRQ